LLTSRCQFAAASVAALASVQAYANPPNTIQFNLTVSAGAKTCLPKAYAQVTDHTFGDTENLEVVVHNLAPNTNFDFHNSGSELAVRGRLVHGRH
jgi:hypothetical protein